MSDISEKPIESGTKSIMLVCPPFQHSRLASISVAQLATFLRSHDIACTEAYFHLEFMNVCGFETYQMATFKRGDSETAEMIFAEAYYGKIDSTWEEKLTDKFGPASERQSLVHTFTKRCLQRIADENADIIGFTTSYNQMMASLYLAREIKKQTDTPIVFGGTACGGEMGETIVAKYADVDYVISGTGESTLLNICQGKFPQSAFTADHGHVPIEKLPLPDYYNLLREAEEFGYDENIQVLYQSSRGCWWGQKKHCKFCGLNGDQIDFEPKPTRQVLEEIRTLWERHGRNIVTTDCVLSKKHLKEVVPDLMLFKARPQIFYEVKTNLTEKQVKTLGQAGISAQVGIESLSSRLLKLMSKGGSTLKTLAILKWAREYEFTISWNLLFQIPGEQLSDYEEQMDLIKKIHHLPPPRTANRIHIDRYSPYFDDYKEYGWTDIAPADHYPQLHQDLSPEELKRVAYHFKGVGGIASDAYADRLTEAVTEWNTAYKTSGLLLDASYSLTRVENGNNTPLETTQIMREILAITNQIIPVKTVIEETKCNETELKEMMDDGIVYIEKDNVINLAIRPAHLLL